VTDVAGPSPVAAAALDHINDGLILVDEDWTITYVNGVAVELVDHTRQEMLGVRFWDVFPEAYDHEFGLAYRRAMDTRTEVRLEAYYGPLLGWFDVRAIPSDDGGVTLCFQNVNERRAAAAAQDALVRSIMAVAESMTIEEITVALDEAVLLVVGGAITDVVIFDGPDDGPTDVAVTAKSVSVPLVAGRRAVGRVDVPWDAEVDLDPQTLRFLRMLGAQGGAAVERMRSMAHQRAIAETLQQAMLPATLPAADGAEIAACYLPATKGLSVGGDWYDALELRDGRIIVAVGDVAGHGVEAAAAMGQVRNALRAYAVEGHPPSTLLHLLDVLIDEAGLDLFTTAIVAAYDPTSGSLTCASAGHLPPIIWTDAGARVLDIAPGAPIGVRGPQPYTEHTVVLEPGDALVAYTDGLVERRGESIDDGIERLRAAIEALSSRAPAIACDAIAAAVTSDGRADDICVLALRRTS
jgi:PAS domain S-box-containing protein